MAILTVDTLSEAEATMAITNIQAINPAILQGPPAGRVANITAIAQNIINVRVPVIATQLPVPPGGALLPANIRGSIKRHLEEKRATLVVAARGDTEITVAIGELITQL